MIYRHVSSLLSLMPQNVMIFWIWPNQHHVHWNSCPFWLCAYLGVSTLFPGLSDGLSFLWDLIEADVLGRATLVEIT